MKRLTAMARVLGSTKAKIAKLEGELKKLAAQETLIENEDMPELMRELEMKDFTLKDGTQIKVVEDIQCGITEANKPAAHKWLRDNKLGGVIKVLLVQQYAAGEDAVALANAEAISKLTGHETSLGESVHAGTLKALLKEQRRKGTKIPANLFGLYPFSKAKVIPPKG